MAASLCTTLDMTEDALYAIGYALPHDFGTDEVK